MTAKSLEINEELPTGWTITDFENVLLRMSNGTTKKQSKQKTGIPVTRIETISNGTVDLERVGFISEPDKDLIRQFRLNLGDILFSHINSDSHLGKTALFNLENITLLHGMNLLLLRPDENIIDPKFLNYLCQHYRFQGKFVSIAQHAVNQSSINQTKLKKVKIPLSPLPEQRRIVGKVELLFSFLDAGVAQLRLVQGQLKRYRQAVLKAAFEGKLAYTDKSISERPKAPLENVTSLITKGESPAWQGFEYVDQGVIFIRSENVLWGTLNLSNAAYIPEQFHQKLKRSQVKSGDVLVNLVGASIGRCTVVPEAIQSANVNQAVAVIRVSKEIIPDYLMHFIISPQIQRILQENKVETARPNISLTDLRQLNIPVPPIRVQIALLAEIERLYFISGKVSELVEQQRIQIERLRQSILKDAFTGKLVHQDSSDEPAHELLERIRVESLSNKSKNKSQVELSKYVK